MHFGQIGFWQTTQRSVQIWPGCRRQVRGASEPAAPGSGALDAGDVARDTRNRGADVATGASGGGTGTAGGNEAAGATDASSCRIRLLT